MKKRVIVLIIIGALILSGCILFVSTRYSKYTTYVPFSGWIFSANTEQISKIRIQQQGDYKEYSGQQEINSIVEVLNDFRYDYWFPDIPIQRAGWNYQITIYNGDESVSYYFGDIYIHVRGVYYVCSEQYVNQLKEFLGS